MTLFRNPIPMLWCDLEGQNSARTQHFGPLVTLSEAKPHTMIDFLLAFLIPVWLRNRETREPPALTFRARARVDSRNNDKIAT